MSQYETGVDVRRCHDAAMEYRQLGRSGLRISPITLGTMTFGGEGIFAVAGAAQLPDATRLIDIALDAGVNLIDTADAYSSGGAEEIIGQALRGRRDRMLISTKVRFATGTGPNDSGLSRHHIIEACEASLRRLEADHIDLYQVHEWDGETPLEETLAALDHLVGSGKVRYVGCSNYAAWQMTKALGIAERRGLTRFVSTQVYFSLQERSVEHEIIPACLDQGLGMLIWSPLAGGLLSGKYRRDRDAPGSGRHLDERWPEPPIYDREALYDTIEVIVEVAAEIDATPAQVALAWLLHRPGVTSVIAGARTPAQFTANLAAADLSLDGDVLGRLDQVSRPALPYPRWHQATSASDRLGDPDRAVTAPYLETLQLAPVRGS
jgi:aryl-alcohol dehydrogenase-like predicted oxidoreductase